MGAAVAAPRPGSETVVALPSGRRVHLSEPGPTAARAPIKLLVRSNCAAQLPAGGQKPIELLLVHLVPMQQPIGGPVVEGHVLDVLADDPGALLVAAAEEIAAIVIVRRGSALVSSCWCVMVTPTAPLSITPRYGANMVPPRNVDLRCNHKLYRSSEPPDNAESRRGPLVIILVPAMPACISSGLNENHWSLAICISLPSAALFASI